MARCLVLLPVAYCNVIAGGDCEEEHLTDVVCQGLFMCLMGLGMLWAFFTVLTILLMAPLLFSAGFFFFGWVPVLAMGKALRTSCNECLVMLCVCMWPRPVHYQYLTILNR